MSPVAFLLVTMFASIVVSSLVACAIILLALL